MRCQHTGPVLCATGKATNVRNGTARPPYSLATFRGCKARFLTIWPPHDAAEIVLLAERKLGDMLAVVLESSQGELVAGVIELAHEQATGS